MDPEPPSSPPTPSEPDSVCATREPLIVTPKRSLDTRGSIEIPRPPVVSDDPDEDIVRMVAGGENVGALNLLMKRYGRDVYRYCREELRDASLADDVLQNVFIGAYRALPTFAGRSKLRTWLFAIAHNRVLDAAKGRRRYRAHFDYDDTADTPDPTSAPGDRLDDAALGLALSACVAKLPEKARHAVLLHYQMGLTFEEMARMSGKKAGTLQARVARALKRLQTCVERCTRGKL